MEVVNGSSSRKKHTTKEKLPHDLIIEILSWLHINHLYPLRFVSKSWFHLLTKDPQFAKLQFHRFKHSHPDPSIVGTPRDFKNSKLVLAAEFISCDEAFLVDFPFYQPTNRYHLCSISNGLLCIVASSNEEVYIWNPLINDHITISCLPAPVIRFPDCNCYTMFRFGFDQVSNVYKVVRFFNETDFDKIGDSQTQISVFTVGVDSVWRTVQADISHYVTFICFGIIVPLVNGVFHWRKTRLGTYSCDLIVTFDLNEEVVGELMLPECIKIREIVELSGLLSVIEESDKEQIQIWVMKEYGVVSSWSKQYVVAKPEEYLCTLGVSHNGEIIIETAGENLVLYNPETDTMKNLKQFQFPVFRAYTFLGSLMSPTDISQGDHNLLEMESRRGGSI